MIEELRIRGIGVIEDATLELHPGFSVVTGETGAGKTMVLTGLDLVLGGKADSAVVRGDKAEVDGRFLTLNEQVIERIEQAGGELDEGALLIGRTVAREGRSRSFLGGRAVPLSVLAELSDALVAVHGQNDQRRLLAPQRQRAALDRYAGSELLELTVRYREAFDRLRQIEREIQEITTLARERAREAELLRAGIEEISAVAPVRGEWEELAAATARLSHAESLREVADQARGLIRGMDETGADADALGQLDAARRALESQRTHDPVLGQFADSLGEGIAIVADVASELASYVASIDSDPRSLEQRQQRTAALNALMRRYAPTVDEVVDWFEAAQARLSTLEGDDEQLLALSSEQLNVREQAAQLATSLSHARHNAADAFSRAVSAELTELAMPNAQVSVDIRHADHPDGLDVVIDGVRRRVAFGASGIDEIELLLSPHPGAPARPISKGASGGELSRVMLAIEVVFAGTDPVPTFVFDEVDAGVGGRAAIEIGRRLARLARSAQVLIVTHLPQVAAFADRHIVVEKSDDGQITTSGVRVLNDSERVTELARMLAGMADSSSAAAHAQELLELAALEREQPLSKPARKAKSGESSGPTRRGH
jgi:DNA repair protein RecN (Recombination protein N)